MKKKNIDVSTLPKSPPVQPQPVQPNAPNGLDNILQAQGV